MNPVKFVVGLYVLSAFDLGMTTGAVEGEPSNPAMVVL